ncbi:MAG: hypothetical protein ABIH52_02720 [Candidatus Aenigmatarchaeota archaeon]|nr:hypothetical protein [Nanoarchaeota archaeon]
MRNWTLQAVTFMLVIVILWIFRPASHQLKEVEGKTNSTVYKSHKSEGENGHQCLWLAWPDSIIYICNANTTDNSLDDPDDLFLIGKIFGDSILVSIKYCDSTVYADSMWYGEIFSFDKGIRKGEEILEYWNRIIW